MSDSLAHSNFFSLDVTVDNSSFSGIDLPIEVFERAQRTLEAWTDITPESSTHPPTLSSPITTDDTSSSPCPKSRSSSPKTSLSLSETSRIIDCKDGKLAKITKTFHFVENSDKKTATRLRNTMASRNLRQSKVNRIAQLERELEKQLQETELWRKRALAAGWKQ